MPGLIERSAELSAVEGMLADAEGGTGRLLLVCGPAGVGKSALVGQAEDLARSRGFTVLRSCPTPVSTTLAHTVVRDWLGPLARLGRPGTTPFDGPAAQLARALSKPVPDHQAWSLNSLDYGVGWVLDNLAETRPVLLVVDDVQWADTGSLELLDLLSARLRHAPVALVLARRTGEAVSRTDLLQRVTSRGTTLTPQPLSVVGVEQMRREVMAEEGPTDLSAAELHRLTGGLPFLVRELLRAGFSSTGGAPVAVVESVQDRLNRLGEPILQLARTIAVLGDEATFDALGELCGFTVAELADPLEVLTDADIVTLGLWRAWPAHPLVREAVLTSMSPSDRSDQHRRAAEYLAKLDRSRQVVASHLVHTLPDEDDTVVALLRDAAQESLASGAPQVAATQLLRAVGETRPEGTDPRLIREAAEAHLRAGLVEQSVELWRRALARMSAPDDRAGCLVDLAEAQLMLGDRTSARASYHQAGRILTAAGHDSGSPALRLLHTRAALVRTMGEGAQPAIETASAQPHDDDTHADRLRFTVEATRLTMAGRDHDQAAALALRATADSRLLEEETCDGNSYYTAVAVLSWTDRFTDALAAADAALADSHRRGSPLGFATASYARGFAHYRQGTLRRAVIDLDAALAMRTRDWGAWTEYALAALSAAHLGLGQTEPALALEPELREVADRGGVPGAVARTGAGMVRAAVADHEQALADYQAARQLLSPAAQNAAVVEWRELTAWSLMQLGRRSEARTVAEDALERARAWGAPRTVGFALRTMSHLVPPRRAASLLREAVHLFESCRAVDQLARARVELGALLVRTTAGRAEGAGLLQQALDHARVEDVPSIEQRVKDILRRHRIPVAAAPGSPLHLLTPGERRVVQLAVLGHTNRRIAQELFVTVKAVEWHLSNAYRKLGISSRAQLPGALAGQPDRDVPPSSSSER